MFGLLQLLAVGLVAALAVVTWFTMHRLRRPPRKGYAWAVARGRPGDPSELDRPRRFEAVRLPTGGGGGRGRDAEAWRVVGEAPSGPTVVFTPGWADSKLGVLPRLGALAPSASEVFAWDPPGHGDAPGACALGTREPGMIAAMARGLLDDAPSRRIVLIGSSLGAGASIAAGVLMGDERRLVGVIAEGVYRFPTTPARNVIRQAGLPWLPSGPIAFWLMGLRLGVGGAWSGFDRAAWAARLDRPLLVLHGTADAVCPVEDARAVADAAPRSDLVLIEGGGHNNLWTDERFGPRTAECVRRFVEMR